MAKMSIEVDDYGYSDTLQHLAIKYGVSRKKLIELAVEDFWKGLITEAEEYRKNGGRSTVDRLFGHIGANFVKGPRETYSSFAEASEKGALPEGVKIMTEEEFYKKYPKQAIVQDYTKGMTSEEKEQFKNDWFMTYGPLSTMSPEFNTEVLGAKIKEIENLTDNEIVQNYTEIKPDYDMRKDINLNKAIDSAVDKLFEPDGANHLIKIVEDLTNKTTENDKAPWE